MARNRNKNGSSKRKPNPAHYVPKRVPRPIVSFDGTIMRGTHLATRDLTAVNVASHNLIIDCAGTFGSVLVTKIFESIGRDLTGITSRYSEYRYKSVTCTWLPHVAPGVADGGSSIFVGYIDNPELMFQSVALGPIVDNTNIRGVRNMKTFNAWQGFTYHVPLTQRRKWFDVNTITGYVSHDEFERSVQGMVIAGCTSIGAAVDLGQWRTVYEVEIKGLSTTFTS